MMREAKLEDKQIFFGGDASVWRHHCTPDIFFFCFVFYKDPTIRGGGTIFKEGGRKFQSCNPSR